MIKQRSDAWFNIRKESAVTGSTINTDVGLDRLNKQREHFQIKAGERSENEIPEDLQKKCSCNHTRGECCSSACFQISASICSTFVILRRRVLYRKRGRKLKMQRKRKAHYGIEIKCPFPGKTFTTPVHYGIPHYYVCQVQSEMHSLGVDKLLFLSYSKESMTVHEITYDVYYGRRYMN